MSDLACEWLTVHESLSPVKVEEMIFEYNKHLMTGPKGNSEYCFPETLNVSRGASHQVFYYTSRLKKRKNCEKIIWLTHLQMVAAFAGRAIKTELLY